MKKCSILLGGFVILFLSLISIGVVHASHTSTSQYGYSTKVWKSGDIYDVGGVKGIIFALSSDKQHGQLLSLNQTYDDWDDAEAWCRTLGPGWTLPTKMDLELLHLVFNKINEVLEREGCERVDGSYWTRECPNDYEAYAVWVGSSFASPSCRNKYNNNYRARAVRKF